VSWTNYTLDTELANYSLVWSFNTSWIYTSAPHTNVSDSDIATSMQNYSIVRSYNLTWLDDWYLGKGYYTSTNFTTDYYAITSRYTPSNFTTDYYAIGSRYTTTNHTAEVHPYLSNASDGYMTLFNVTTNLTIGSGTGFAGIWHNGSGICISSC